MSPHSRLWEAIRGEQDRARARGRYLAIARSRRPIGRPRARSRARLGWVSFAALPAVAAAAVWALPWRVSPADLTFIQADGQVGHVGETIAAPPVAPWPLKFSDGSVVSLYAGSHARVSAVNANGARIVVDRGGASASVVHRSGSRWVIVAGPFEVFVSGTRFEVNWDSNEEVFRLDLEEGSVLVSGPCMSEPKSVARGDHLRLSCGSKHRTTSGMPDPVDGVAEAALPHAEPGATESGAGPKDSRMAGAASAGGPARARALAHATPTAPSVLQTDEWRRLVDAGRYREALDRVEQRGFEQECRRAPGADLLVLGDVARFAGDAARARLAYAAARDKLQGGGRSAYGLGLIAFDQERDFAGAAQWFETYLAEQPEGDLRREAAGRAMEAWHLAGEGTRARAAAQRYLRQYPDGLQAPLARQLSTGF